MITAELPVAQWHDMIGELTIADAILDRITTPSPLNMRTCVEEAPRTLTAVENSENEYHLTYRARVVKIGSTRPSRPSEAQRKESQLTV